VGAVICHHSDSQTPTNTMGALAFLRNVYDVDSLDTRFTTPSGVSYKVSRDARGDNGRTNERTIDKDPRVQPSKWRTPEFFLYGLVVAIAVPSMLWVPYIVSQSMSKSGPCLLSYG
jgi:protein-cysteine N-palmitoyltransferase HHAT